jgi:hypothetical protein
VDKELVAHLRNATIIYIRPIVNNRLQLESVRQFLELEAEDVDVNIIFYFEMALRGIYAVKQVIKF